MLRFLLALIAGLALLVPAPAEAGLLGRFLYRASHPFTPIGSYAGPKGLGSGFGRNANHAGSAQTGNPPACSEPTCTPAKGLGAEPVTGRHSELHNRNAQGVANLMAHYGRVGHHGGNPGYEGCGMAGSPQAAYSICCYSTSGMKTVDVGYARGANGMWYCCRRYQ